MIHKMHLVPHAFEMIRDGSKSYELRLYDEKRSQVQVGDTICFSSSENPKEKVSARVQQMVISKSFKELYKKIPLICCGYTKDNVDNARPEDMEVFYTPEQQKIWGVVAFRLELMN